MRIGALYRAGSSPSKNQVDLAAVGLAGKAGERYNVHVDIDDFLAGRDESRRIFELLRAAVLSLGPVEVRFTRSQVAFVFGRPFAWAWAPEMHLRRKAAPLVLTLSFAARRESSRWKEIYEAKPGRFTHHLELWTGGEIDGEVVDWLREARDSVSSDSLGHRRSRPAP